MAIVSYGRISVTKLSNGKDGDDGITVNLATEHVSIPVDGNLFILEAPVKRIPVKCYRGVTNITSTATIRVTTVLETTDQLDIYVDANNNIVVTPTLGGQLPWKSKDIEVSISVPNSGTLNKVIHIETALSTEISIGSTNLARDTRTLAMHPITALRCNITKTVTDDATRLSSKSLNFTFDSVSSTTQDVGFEIEDLFSSPNYNGKVFTLSFYIKASKEIIISKLGFDSGGFISTSPHIDGCVVTTSWTKVTRTWTYNLAGASKFIMKAVNVFTAGTVISISDIKIESGYFATDWNPNPSDTEDELNELFSETERINMEYRNIHAAINGDPETLNPGLIADLETLRDKGAGFDKYIRDYFAENGIIDQIKESISTISGGQDGLRGEVSDFIAKYTDSNQGMLDIVNRASTVAQTANDWIASFKEDGTTIGSLNFDPRNGLTVMTDNVSDDDDQNYRTTISSKQFVCQMWDPNTQGYTKEVFSLSEDLFITKRLSVTNGVDMGILKFVNTQDNGVQGIDVVLGEGVDD